MGWVDVRARAVYFEARDRDFAADFAAGFLAFAAGLASPPVFAASTLALSASSRSTAGAAGASGSSGGGSSAPSSLASSSACRSRR